MYGKWRRLNGGGASDGPRWARAHRLLPHRHDFPHTINLRLPQKDWKFRTLLFRSLILRRRRVSEMASSVIFGLLFETVLPTLGVVSALESRFFRVPSGASRPRPVPTRRVLRDRQPPISEVQATKDW